MFRGHIKKFGLLHLLFFKTSKLISFWFIIFTIFLEIKTYFFKEKDLDKKTNMLTSKLHYEMNYPTKIRKKGNHGYIYSHDFLLFMMLYMM